MEEKPMSGQDRQDDAPLEVESGQEILEAEEIPSAVLRRLAEEVRTEKLEPATAYNRTHNRHNRGR